MISTRRTEYDNNAFQFHVKVLNVHFPSFVSLQEFDASTNPKISETRFSESFENAELTYYFENIPTKRSNPENKSAIILNGYQSKSGHSNRSRDANLCS